MKEFLESVLTWKMPDGKIATTYFLKEAFLKSGLSEDAFIANSLQKLMVSNPEFIGRQHTKRNMADIKSILDQNKRKVVESNGSLSIDPSIKTEVEKQNEKLDAAKKELKKLGLSDGSVEALAMGGLKHGVS